MVLTCLESTLPTMSASSSSAGAAASPERASSALGKTPRTSTRRKAPVDYSDPGPLSLKEIRSARPTGGKRKKSSASKRTTAPSFDSDDLDDDDDDDSGDGESTVASAKRKKPSAATAKKKPAARRAAAASDDGYDDSTASPRASSSAASALAREERSALEKQVRKWRSAYEKLDKERTTEAERELKRERKRAKQGSEALRESAAATRRLEQRLKAAEEKLAVFATLTGFDVDVADLEDADGTSEYDIVATSNFFDRELKFVLTLEDGSSDVYFEPESGEDCLPPNMRGALTFSKDQFPRMVSRVLACVHRKPSADL